MKNTVKKYKMVSFTPEYECSKNPPCSFCYLKRHSVYYALKLDRKTEQDRIKSLNQALSRYTNSAEQLTIAVNKTNLNLAPFLKHLKSSLIVNFTMIPHSFSWDYVLTLKTYLIIYDLTLGMISLSLDPEKGGIKSWLKAIQKFESSRKANYKKLGNLSSETFKIGANVLMLDEMFAEILKPEFKSVLRIADQVHFLRPKFYEPEIPLKLRKMILHYFAFKYKNVFIDQCFRNEFYNIPCSKGKDFISINPDATVTGCSFELAMSTKRKPEKKCPFI